ncbi:hypothetical protein Tco_1043759 [Tanacetum coccineum]|uniref:Retroviral polymerase SH3-like domain-containing protein n=1 Tax=Tanacetum coccineum TaxID=301880 RepID=A0ABQ5GNI0_9ASTR
MEKAVKRGECNSRRRLRIHAVSATTFATPRYVVPTGRVKVPASRYVVPTGKDNVIVSAGRTKVIPAGRTILVLDSPPHMADFHHIDDAMGYWSAVKARFGGNDRFESKNNEESQCFKHVFFEFGYSISGGSAYKAMKRHFHLPWSQVAITLKTKARFEKGKSMEKDEVYNKDAARFDKSKEMDKVEEPKALLSVDSMLNWSDHEGEDVENGAAQVYGMIAGAEEDAAGSATGDATGDVVDVVSNAAAEFALMGISSQVKLEESKARFDKWKDSSKNLDKMIHSSMSSRSKFGLGFGETFGSDEVFDPSAPSIDKSSDSETIGFASCVSSVKSSSSKNNEPLASAPSSVDFKIVSETADQQPSSTNDDSSFSFKENVKPPRNLCNKSGISSRSLCKRKSFGSKTCFVCGSKFYLIKDCDFYEKQLELHNKPMWNNVANIPSFVPKAASVCAGSRNKPTSVPAGSRNRPTSVPASRSFSAGGTGGLYGGGDGVPHLRFSQVVLRIPRRHNLYCFSLSDIQPERDVTCLLAKASLEESTKWHRRMAHTPYELVSGKVPNISHLKPFGYLVTILNTSDHLERFEGKAEEGFIVGYAAHSKAYRVYNLSSKKIEETLNLRYLEEKPNVQGLGHEWYFDLDYLTDSLGTQANSDLECDEQVIVKFLSFPQTLLHSTKLMKLQTWWIAVQICRGTKLRLQKQAYEANATAEKHLSQADLATSRNRVPAGKVDSAAGVTDGPTDPSTPVFQPVHYC